MKNLLLLTLALAHCAVFAADTKIKVMLVTGGHGYSTNQFLRVFEENPAITFTNVVQAKNSSTAYDRADLLSYDCVVLYDMVQNITDTQKARFLSLFDKGVGLVVTHHALVSYQAWPEFERIIGGIYPEPQDQKGKVTPELGYEHDVQVPVVIEPREHPITAGLKDFTITDEIYWGFRTTRDALPLITTTQPKSGKPLAWYRTEKNSRVVYLQLGHGPSAYNDANYRKLLAQIIQWAARK